MRISELSRRTGVPVPAIKYYLREGLLGPGERTSPNQVRYDERHVHRLKLVRALLEVGELSVADAGAVLAAIDAPGISAHAMLGTAQRSVARPYRRPEGDAREWADRRVADLVRTRGWHSKEDSPARLALVEVLATARALGHADVAELLDHYADAAGRLATLELDWVARGRDADSLAERAVVGTVIGDAIVTAVRRLAQAHESDRRFGAIDRGRLGSDRVDKEKR